MAETANAAEGAPRPLGRPFAPGQSGNPKGRPRRCDVARQLEESEAENVPLAVAKLYALGMAGDVPALCAYLNYFLGKPRPMPQPLPPALPPAPGAPGDGNGNSAPRALLDSVDAAAYEATAESVRLLSAQISQLRAKAETEGLTCEELAQLNDCTRTVAGIGKWHTDLEGQIKKHLDSLPAGERRELAERSMCEALGVTVEQVRAMRAQGQPIDVQALLPPTDEEAKP